KLSNQGVVYPKSYYLLVKSGKIDIIAPARMTGYAEDGRWVLLDNGKKVAAKVIILATGWQSSWKKIFDDRTALEIGLGRHAPTIEGIKAQDLWSYKTLVDPPPTHIENQTQHYVTSTYRCLIPGKNVNNRDFAFSANQGYTNEVDAHWISSFLQGDPMRFPSFPEEAIAEVELSSAWMRRRYPNMLSWVNESYSTTLDFWTWPQAADQLLEDLYLRSMRSGGNWFTWPFKVMDLKEVSSLREEREAIRKKYK
ncbi:hypothetical protein CPB84DRAFT_1679400, partial [Gymnopilus junonius]